MKPSGYLNMKANKIEAENLEQHMLISFNDTCKSQYFFDGISIKNLAEWINFSIGIIEEATADAIDLI
nr:hypothetical protein [Tanacetum cinerariifolium]